MLTHGNLYLAYTLHQDPVNPKLYPPESRNPKALIPKTLHPKTLSPQSEAKP